MLSTKYKHHAAKVHPPHQGCAKFVHDKPAAFEGAEEVEMLAKKNDNIDIILNSQKKKTRKNKIKRT